MFGTVFFLESISLSSLLRNGLRRALIAVSILGFSIAIVGWAHGPFPVQLLVAAILVLGFVVVSWTHILDSRDRNLVLVTISHFRLAFVRA